ncbi:SRPBCC domain-containing protein [Ahrensia sp. R2A130]|uniref:SRPBCC domain-containing protein n=1 Tax=Ahrensia sp. R2A130 TaxID=744979 RepID=UPI0001E0BC3E|nr:SRPBCC domain-containing protein [Ahrensia sp. R2A130]EFL90752.1 putative toxin-antitoxin system, toxin component [Ahrensia sp. R2A130]
MTATAPQTTLEEPDFILATDIAAPPKKVWEALTESNHVRAYHFAFCTIEGQLKQGERFDHKLPDGNLMLGGKVISVDPPHRLEMTFEPGWAGPDAQSSRCVYEIEATDTGSRFTVLHFAIPEGQDGVKEGWANIANRLKAYLEDGITNQEYEA